MHNEFVQSCFQDCFLSVLYIKKIVPSTLFCVCLKHFRTNFTDSHMPVLRGGFPFLDGVFFFQCVCKRCFVRIHVQNSYDFRSLIFLWLVILYLLWQSVVIVTGCHWGFYFQTSNAIWKKHFRLSFQSPFSFLFCAKTTEIIFTKNLLANVVKKHVRLPSQPPFSFLFCTNTKKNCADKKSACEWREETRQTYFQSRRGNS